MAEDENVDVETPEGEVPEAVESDTAETTEPEAAAPEAPEEEVDLGPPPEPPEELPPVECPKCAGGGAPAWMATFADMATLLMAFFVQLLVELLSHAVLTMRLLPTAMALTACTGSFTISC